MTTSDQFDGTLDYQEWCANHPIEHDGRCRCGATVPCGEPDCTEPDGHEYPCHECLRRDRDRPDPLDMALERMYD